MNNVFNMYQNKSAMDNIRLDGYGDADFGIFEGALTYDTPYGEKTCSKRIVYRDDDGSELGVHGKRYVPVAPRDMIESARKIIERSDLNLTDLTEDIQMSHGGGRTYVRYTMPHHTYPTPDGDTATLELLATTSLDSTWPFMISVGAHQAACLNTQVFTSGTVAVYKSKHMKGLDIEHGSNVIVKCLGAFENEREQWDTWMNTKMSESDAFKFFAKAVNATSALDKMKEDAYKYASPFAIMLDSRTNKNLNYIWDKFIEHYVPAFGSNQWAVYNALTDWSSHAPSSKNADPANLAARLHKRRETVRTAIDAWSIAA